MHSILAASLSQPLFVTVPPQLAAMILLATPPIILVAFIVVGVFVLGIGLRGFIFLGRRHEEMNAMALRLGLRSWSGDSLPRGLSLQGTAFFNHSKLENIYEGVINQHEVVVLDFHKRDSSSHWSRTIIAVKNSTSIGLPAGLESRRVGQWQVIYAPVGYSNSPNLIDIDRLELFLKNIPV